ncbi:MAG: hypothetical protein ABGW90_14700, partial [Martelella sp.]
MGRAQIIPENPSAIFLPYQARWIGDKSRLKLMEKGRQIGLSWSTAYATVSRTAVETARHDQWVSSRDEMQAILFIEDCKLWARILDLAARDMGEQVIDLEKKHTARVLKFLSERSIYSMSSNADAQAGKRGGVLVCRVQSKPQEVPPDLWLIFAPVKKARTDFIVEKAVELGVRR